MFKKILALDQWLFLKINRGLHHDWLDGFMLLIREAKFWIPFYFFIFLFGLFNFGRQVWGWAIAAGLTVAFTDSISSKIIKPLVGRPRPCADDIFSAQVNLVASYCGGNGSFTSSHAANHFGIAMFFFLTLRHLYPRLGWPLFSWASVICLAQVYAGVHYPTDIMGGAILGLLCGWFMASLHQAYIGRLQYSPIISLQEKE